MWIDWFRNRDFTAALTMEKLAQQPELIATTQPVLMEVRAGAQPAVLTRLEEVLAGSVQLDLDPAVDFHQAADLYRAVRRAGDTVRSLVGCLIASVALRTGARLVHKDIDYERLAAVAPGLRTMPLFD
ncbi:putative nucleic acid-binding protein [Crossiella equi]|uniref:Nucleic acid-binding protein n=1 Tax=Crossiella equi TaxID=130796 RepID=A0ABS5AK24_9PSEU|nr:PIN domain-containing protein [Crossiella equi]MBP2476924.1 putative nucleic acid-binding protein [Crossiella equi]